MESYEAYIQTTVFRIISEATGIPQSEVNGQTVIRRELRMDIVGRVASALHIPLQVNNQGNLTAGQVVEAAASRIGD